jgi:hypothetical protein
MGEMSAAMMTMAVGSVEVVVLDLRSALTTSLTPRRRVLDLAAAGHRQHIEVRMQWNKGHGTYIS